MVMMITALSETIKIPQWFSSVMSAPPPRDRRQIDIHVAGWAPSANVVATKPVLLGAPKHPTGDGAGSNTSS